MKSWLTVAGVLLFVSSCATAPSGAARAPVPLAGQWSGTFISQEMVSALGRVESPARLTVTEDGRFTLTSSGGTVIAGVARPTARGLALDGRVTAGDAMAVGRGVSFDLRSGRGNTLYGDGETFYLGHRIDSGLLLRPA